MACGPGRGLGGLRADRDITPVEEHAGRNIGMTRAEAYAQLYGPAPGNSETTAQQTADGNSSSDPGNDQPEKPGTGHTHDSSLALEGQETDTGTAQPASDANTREEAGTSDADGDHEATRPGSGGDRDTGILSDNPGVEGTAIRTPARPEPPDSTEAAGPVPAARERGQEDMARRHDDRTGNLDSEPATAPTRPADGQGTHDRDGEDTGKRPQRGPENPGPAEPRPDTPEGEATETSSADAPAQKQKDQPDGRNPAPDVSPDQPGEGETDATPDRHADEQRWEAMEHRMQTALDDMRAGYESKVDNLQATYELKVESLKAEYDAGMARSRQEISDLKTELEELKADHDRPASDGSAKDGTDPSSKADAPPAGENDSPGKPDTDPEPAHTRDKELDTSGKRRNAIPSRATAPDGGLMPRRDCMARSARRSCSPPRISSFRVSRIRPSICSWEA